MYVMDFNMNTSTPTSVHAFELSGLGQAPYRFIGEIDLGRARSHCQFCGHLIRYQEIILDKNNNRFVVGNECIYKHGDAGMVSLVKKAKSERAAKQKLAREEEKRKKREEELQRQREANGGLTDAELSARTTQQGFIDAFFDTNENIQDAFNWAINDQSAWYVAKDIATKVLLGKTLSEKQVNTIRNAYARTLKPAIEKSPCPSGKHKIAGEVISISTRESFSAYGYAKIRYCMLVEDANGFRVWGTVPSSVDVAKGDIIQFTANIEPSPKDEFFGFYKNPSGALVLSKAK